MTAGQKCNSLVGLLYGGYANVVIYGDISGDDHYIGRAIVIRWDEHCDWRERVKWDYAKESVATPTYIRESLGQTDYRSPEHATDVVRVFRPGGQWERLTRDEAARLVSENGWPTNANQQPRRPIRL